ncbi:Coronin [Plasmodiophora brassicae]
MASSTSKYRLVRCDLVKGGTVDLSTVVGKPASASTSPCVATSASYTATPVASAAGSVVVVPNASPSPFVVSAHAKGVNDAAFSLFDAGLLATCGQDGTLATWRLANDRAEAGVRVPVAAALSIVRPHPSCNGIFATAGNDGVAVVDVSAGGDVVGERASDDGTVVYAVDWARDGSTISVVRGAKSTGANGALVQVDVRGKSKAPVYDLQGLRPHQVVNLGSSSLVAVLGQDQFRAPRVALVDVRQPDAPLLTESLQLSAGTCLATYDVDTALMSVTTRGSSSLLVFDMSAAALTTDKRLRQLQTFASSSSFQGLASVPKRQCDVLGAEIARLRQLTTASMETISLTMPRKGGRQFHADLFPDTDDDQRPALTPGQFRSGANAFPNVSPVLEKVPETRSSSTTLTAPPSSRASVSTADMIAALDDGLSESRRQLDQRLKRSSMTHVNGTESKSLDAQWYSIRPSDASVPLALSIVANRRVMAIPWRSLAGSAVAVIPLAALGRVPDNVGVIRAHPQPLAGLAISDDDLVTACGDGHVRVWALPNDLPKEDVVEPRLDLLTSGKVTSVALNPGAPTVLATASQSYDNKVDVALWDITSPATSSRPAIELRSSHPDVVLDMAFSDDGALLATICRDRHCRVFDPRKGTAPIVCFPIEEGVRDTRVLWVADTGALLTVGFGPSSSRQISLWAVLTGTAVRQGGPTRLATHTIDRTSATLIAHYDRDTNLLYVTGQGDRALLFFEVNAQDGGIVLHGRYLCPSIVGGMTWLPKTSCDIAGVEVGRALRLSVDHVKLVSMTIPRKRKEFFQDDLFPATLVPQAISASSWLSGSDPVRRAVDLCPDGMVPLSKAPPEEITVHQRRRLQLRSQDLETTSQPTVEEHIASKLSTIEADPVNRWDATPIADNAVDDDEWE